MKQPQEQTVDEWLVDYNNAAGTFFDGTRVIKYRSLDKLVEYMKDKKEGKK